MNMALPETTPDIHFMHITATTLGQICKLSDTLSTAQRHMVADNVASIAEAHFSVKPSSAAPPAGMAPCPSASR